MLNRDIICICVCLAIMASCVAYSDKQQNETKRAYIAAGYCQDNWGAWKKC